MRARLASIFAVCATLVPMHGAWAQQPHSHPAASAAPPGKSSSDALVPPVTDWRATIDRVHQAGGWKAYLREAQQPAGATPAVSEVLKLQDAIRLVLTQQPDVSQRLVGIDPNAPEWQRLSADQRQALVSRQRRLHAVKSQFYRAQAAQEWAVIQKELFEINAIATELSTRMRKAGNLNAFHLIEEQLKAESARLAMDQAHDRAVQEREQLLQVMGLPIAASALERPTNETPAPAVRMGSKTSLERLVNALAQSEEDHAPDLLARLSQARQVLSRHAMHAEQVEQYQRRILPLRKQLVDEAVLHYNGMIIGVFDLLKEAEHQIQSVQKFLNAQSDLRRSESEIDLELTLLNAHLAQIGRAL